jgi:hypothetical protein
MALILKVAAAVIAVAGLVTLWRGTDPSLLTYGNTLMTVGAVFAGSGIVLFGLGEVAARLEALRAALAGEEPRTASVRSAAVAEAPLEAVEPAAAPLPPTRESLGLRPLGAGAAAAVAASGLAAAATTLPAASPAVADESPRPEPAARPDPALDALLDDIRDAAGEPAGQQIAPVATVEASSAEPDRLSAPLDEPPLLVTEAVPASAGARSDAAPAEPDPLASLSRALEDLTDEIARGPRVEPTPANSPEPVPPPMAAAEPVAVAPAPAPVVPPRDPEQELAELIAAESGAIRGERRPPGAGLDEPSAEPARPAEPDSFLARLRRSMGGGDRKEIDKPREEPVLPAAAPAGLALSEPPADPVAQAPVPANAVVADAAMVAAEPADEPAALPAFSIEAEMERALMASLDTRPLPEPAVGPAAAPVAPPDIPAPVAAPPVVTPPVAAPKPAPVAEPREPAVRDPALATLARDFPELGDLLAPRKPAPADPADALIADLKGIFDSGEAKAARTEPAFEAAAPPPRRPAAPLLREGVIAQIPFRLYGDGTIEADLPEGTTHFGSLREFRAHVGG